MELELEDKVAIVTGSSKGIGKAIAVELAREGCRVVLAARGEKDLEGAAEDVRQTGSAGDVLALAADVTKADEVGGVDRRDRRALRNGRHPRQQRRRNRQTLALSRAL
jgi:NAD(P)-dependent dehydrogenase (short-subunit alcohol dehydrogenase family)